MKKIITAIIVVLLISFFVFCASAKTVKKGDVNVDGRINASDARIVLRAGAQLDEISSEQVIIGDMDNNSKITAADARKILRIASQLDKNDETVQITESETESASRTEQEWLSFFNTAVNKLKSEAPGLIRTKQIIVKDFQTSDPLADIYINAYKDIYTGDIDEIELVGPEATIERISPNGKPFVSSLTMADIKSVNAVVDNSGNYIVTVFMNDMINPDENSSYAKIFEFLSVNDFFTFSPEMGMNFSKEKIKINYTDCYATATITPDGKVVYFETNLNFNINIKDLKIKVLTADIDVNLNSVRTYKNIRW